MNNRINQLAEQLRLAAHPQGGYLGQSYLSETAVTPDDGRGRRPTLSTMYALIVAGYPNKMHSLKADEVWHYCEGSPLELVWIKEGETTLHTATLGNSGENTVPMVTIPGNCWRAARTTGDYTLVSCIVSPAFDPNDFTPIAIKPELIASFKSQHPSLENVL